MARKTAYLQLILALLGIPALADVSTNPVPITVYWDAPTNQSYTNLTYKLYGTTNLTTPITTWPLLTVITNPVLINFGSNQLAFSFPVQPGAWFFTLTASNFWGESSFSNVAPTPPVPPLLNNLRLTRP